MSTEEEGEIVTPLNSNSRFFDEQWKAIYDRNVEDGFPQANYIGFLLKVFPDVKYDLLPASVPIMRGNLSKENTLKWVNLYKRYCGLLRRKVLDRHARDILSQAPTGNSNPGRPVQPHTTPAGKGAKKSKPTGDNSASQTKLF